MTAPAAGDGVLDVLRSVARDSYEHAATAVAASEKSRAAIHEQIADVISAANPTNWTIHAELLPSAVLADQVAAHLYLALRDMTNCDPAVYSGVQQVHALMQSLRTSQ